MVVVVVVVVVVLFWTVGWDDDVVVLAVLFVGEVDVVLETIGWDGHFESFLKSHFLVVESHSNGKLHEIHYPFT